MRFKVGSEVKYNKNIGKIIDIKVDIFGDNVFCVLLADDKKVWTYDEYIKLYKGKRVNWNKLAIKEQMLNEDLKRQIDLFCSGSI